MKKRFVGLLAAGLLTAMCGTQALAYQSMSSWSGQLGSNKWTAVSYYITENDSDSLSHFKWSNSALTARGCRVAMYSEEGKQVLTRDLTPYKGENLPVQYNATKGLQYKLYAQLKNYNSIGVYNSGSWEP